MPAGTMKIHKHTIRIHRLNNEDTYIRVLNRNTIIIVIFMIIILREELTT